ncbi:MAG: AMP-binding protein [Chloroflexi bacterium]|nr:AMP-binding protein [Chloroflexota bacterium]OJW01823.1 MAG: hypothetical protein BGO39_28130 [Chloroflexi bacterium 54-19]
MKKVVLLTGAAGFLGTRLAQRLLAEKDCTILALVRAENQPIATQRLYRAWWDWPDLTAALGKQVEVIAGDVALPSLALSFEDYKRVVAGTTHIIHAAADLRLNGPRPEMRRTNVFGTRNLLELAQAVQQDHGLTRFSYLSTAYVAGRRKGLILEDSLSDTAGFANNYELTKFEGESLVQDARSHLPTSIFRPGMIMGDSRTGAVKTFNTFYYLLRRYLTGRLPFFPASPDLPLNLVPVDYVADSIVRLTFTPEATGLTFHLTAPTEELPAAKEFLEYTRQWANTNLKVSLPKVRFLPAPWLPGRTRFNGPLALLPYLKEPPLFCRDNTDRLSGAYPLKWTSYLPILLEYATAKGFMHRSGRTVHEQILYRLERKNHRVVYRDAAGGKLLTLKADRVRREIVMATHALQKLGIKPGDRVALVGLNSTRYLALLVALGMAGAVSVPLYYTSPPTELATIIKNCGARFLFIGAPALLNRVAEFEDNLTIISFSREGIPPGLARPVMSWEKFIEQGWYSTGQLTAPVGPDDLATLVYTSGTTGQPKGVRFTHRQLRWMGETMAGLLPWQNRYTSNSHLSFLPLNHAVEGILATYAPYYLAGRLEITFLEDFKELPKWLPAVRPTIFFSVPRIYEKLWASFQQSRAGRFYLKTREGPVKHLLRPLLARTLLRKAGLDRCAQLIVGSAPLATPVLRGFQDLGIEIHNAYGLTEAPLVTLNRKGLNRVGTVGSPLPETVVRVAPNGEVLVRGLQVTGGYFERDLEPPLVEGWLHTGDLGYLDSKGYLVIEGRKKEVIATSYAKKIYPQKIEGLLRQGPGVVEAMLVGEGQPHCAALLWIQERQFAPETARALDLAVAEINNQLSHPEQVKSWAVLTYDLSIEQGDLTPNLKLKRPAIACRLEETIKALYGEGEAPGTVLHLGRAEREDSSPATLPEATPVV